MNDNIHQFLLDLSEFPTYAATTPGLERMTRPAPVHPFGPGYSMHPELSRSALGYLFGTSAFATVPLAIALTAGIGFVETASTHQVKGITGEAQFGLPVTNELINLIGSRN